MCCIFFFSSRRRHTRYIGDWSSDVCSSDLIMRQMEHADQCGFDVYSVIDHHFFQKFSISANPLAMFAAAAQRTQRIQIGRASCRERVWVSGVVGVWEERWELE